mmetsp:Transcript_16188/g.33643  ORF Transcript_16188/g.33643 Transcript_16188/m.33643 type:complete len:83 (-) Transcript_16188:179-427(-)
MPYHCCTYNECSAPHATVHRNNGVALQQPHRTYGTVQINSHGSTVRVHAMQCIPDDSVRVTQRNATQRMDEKYITPTILVYT